MPPGWFREWLGCRLWWSCSGVVPNWYSHLSSWITISSPTHCIRPMFAFQIWQVSWQETVSNLAELAFVPIGSDSLPERGWCFRGFIDSTSGPWIFSAIRNQRHTKNSGSSIRDVHSLNAGASLMRLIRASCSVQLCSVFAIFAMKSDDGHRNSILNPSLRFPPSHGRTLPWLFASEWILMNKRFPFFAEVLSFRLFLDRRKFIC